MLTSTMYKPALDRPTGLGLQSICAFPLIEGAATFDPQDITDECENIALPTNMNNLLMGVLVLVNKNKRYGHFFDKNDVGNLQSVFHTCGDIIQAGNAFFQERLQLRRLGELMESMAEDMGAITLGFLSDRVVQLTKSQRGTIFVIDDLTQELYFMIDTPQGKKEIRMPLTPKSMAGASILSNELINIADCYQDERFDPSMDKRTGFHTTQMLCVPIIASGGPIGAIQLINTETGMSFTSADVELMRKFSVYVQVCHCDPTQSIKLYPTRSIKLYPTWASNYHLYLQHQMISEHQTIAPAQSTCQVFLVCLVKF